MQIPKTADVMAKLRAGAAIPAAAMKLIGAPVTFDGTEPDADETNKSLKVHLKLRQRGPIQHWFWGNVIHDFSTARLPSKIALDHTHGDEPIGYARPSLTDYGIEADGAVTPPKDNPQHPAASIAHALRSGIPMQASIDFSGPYDVMEVPEGVTMPMNGMEFKGPGAVICNWTLRAAAICKSGADDSTMTESLYANGAPAPANITVFSQPTPAPEKAAMPEPISPAPAVEAKAEAVATPPSPSPTEAKAVEVTALAEPNPTKDLLAEITALKEKLQTAEGRIEALSKPAAPPIPSTPGDINDMEKPTTWAQALLKVKAENPQIDTVSIVQLAAKAYPEFCKVGWMSPEKKATLHGN